MVISKNFNRFYHSLLGEIYKQLKNPLRFDGIGVIYVANLEQLKMVCKLLNLNYPRDASGEPISTRDISNKKLVEHIEYLIKLAYQNGYEISAVEAEWRKLLNENNYTITKID